MQVSSVLLSTRAGTVYSLQLALVYVHSQHAHDVLRSLLVESYCDFALGNTPLPVSSI